MSDISDPAQIKSATLVSLRHTLVHCLRTTLSPMIGILHKFRGQVPVLRGPTNALYIAIKHRTTSLTRSADPLCAAFVTSSTHTENRMTVECHQVSRRSGETSEGKTFLAIADVHKGSHTDTLTSRPKTHWTRHTHANHPQFYVCAVAL